MSAPHPALRERIIDRDGIAARVAELGTAISADYAGRSLVITCVLKGGFIFLADLVREISVPVSIDFMVISSYGAGTSSSGIVRILKDLDTPIEGRDVLVVEDIVDSGLTLSYLLRNLETRHPASIEVCTLLAKPARRENDVRCRHVGFEIPDAFVVGYGLDAAERFRELPDIWTVDEALL
jgi:hypoxanthine phosphoribosyltransferase